MIIVCPFSLKIEIYVPMRKSVLAFQCIRTTYCVVLFRSVGVPSLREYCTDSWPQIFIVFFILLVSPVDYGRT